MAQPTQSEFRTQMLNYCAPLAHLSGPTLHLCCIPALPREEVLPLLISSLLQTAVALLVSLTLSQIKRKTALLEPLLIE